MEPIDIELSVDQPYGPLQRGFLFKLRSGYTVLTGKNNSGKSSILQFIFSKLVLSVAEFGAQKVCLILPERQFIERHAESRDHSITEYNKNLANTINAHPLSYETMPGERIHQAKLLLHQKNYLKNLQALNILLKKLDFPDLDIGEKQNMNFDNVLITSQGSGLRVILPILSAIAAPDIRVILMDEPELSLEPKAQKTLRDLLQESGKSVVVSTHSHLFLNRKETELDSNYIVRKENENVLLEKIDSESKLYNLVFDLLGNSPNDLFFPENFLVVEGASDQEVVNKVLELKGIEKSKLFVLSARGLSNVSSKINAFTGYLTPYLLGKSIYKDKVVALIDLPINEESNTQVTEIRERLDDRLFLLNASSMEEYLPKELYQKASKDKDSELKKIEGASDEEKKLIKTDISKAISEKLESEDLEKIPKITEAVDKAIESI